MATPKSSSIERGVKILKCFLGRGSALTITEVAQQLDMNVATIHRYILTLESEGLLYRQKGQRYQLGLVLAELGNAVVVSDVLKSVVEPFGQALIQEIGETVHVGVLQNNEVTYLYKAESQRSLQIHTYPGKTLPAYCTAIGKILLSQLNSIQLRDYLSAIKLKQFTNKTIVSEAELRQEMSFIRQQVYALDNEEFEEGLFCVSVPIRQTTGDILAAISASAPISRLNIDNYMAIKDKLAEYANKISHAMFKYNEEEISDD